jgi:hypothetical protein
VCLLPELQDKFLPPQATVTGGQASHETGPQAAGCVDWGPLARLTGTRPAVDHHSITRYSEGEWRQHNTDVLESADKEVNNAKM